MQGVDRRRGGAVPVLGERAAALGADALGAGAERDGDVAGAASGARRALLAHPEALAERGGAPRVVRVVAAPRTTRRSIGPSLGGVGRERPELRH